MQKIPKKTCMVYDDLFVIQRAGVKNCLEHIARSFQRVSEKHLFWEIALLRELGHGLTAEEVAIRHNMTTHTLHRIRRKWRDAALAVLC